MKMEIKSEENNTFSRHRTMFSDINFVTKQNFEHKIDQYDNNDKTNFTKSILLSRVKLHKQQKENGYTQNSIKGVTLNFTRVSCPSEVSI